MSQIQNEEEVVIAYASRSLRLSQRRYCTTRREMLAAVVMCTHFQSYLRGSQFTLRTDHSSLRWLQKFKNEDGMLARWYLLLGQFSVTFEYRPGALHNNADGVLKGVRQFIGFVGYYRRFVKDFAKLADPLVSLTRKGVPFVWGRDQQNSFDSLKACLLCAPILGFPTEDDRFVLDTDASLFAIGGCFESNTK